MVSGRRALGATSRIITLSFKLSGVQEEIGAVKALTVAIQQAILLATILKIATSALMRTPAGILLLAASTLAEAVFIANAFTGSEEVNARGS